MADVVGYSDFRRDADGSVTAIAHTAAGPGDRVRVRVSVEREIRRGGEVVASGEVASSDDGSVRVAEGARL